MLSIKPDELSIKTELQSLAENQASICSVFANPRRILIIWTLAEQEMAVSQIALSIGASLQSTSQHLRLMKETGVLDSRREGQTIYYSINQNEFYFDYSKLPQ